MTKPKAPMIEPSRPSKDGKAPMSESPAFDEPRDAATLMLVDASGPKPRILMGQRRLDLAFMPGKYVFPGGRVDACDCEALCHTDLRELDLQRLLLDMKGGASNARARGLALAAVRETFEETGLVIGDSGLPGQKGLPGQNRMATKDASSGNAAAAAATGIGVGGARAGAQSSWQQFYDLGQSPRLDGLTFFARAVTPPGRTRRYDTRFFFADASQVSHDTERRDDELLELHWLTLDETRSFDLASITRVILGDLAERLERGPSHGPAVSAVTSAPVPYYYFQNNSFRRELLGR